MLWVPQRAGDVIIFTEALTHAKATRDVQWRGHGVHGKIGAVFKCLGPAHIGLQLPWAEMRALAPEERVAAVAASLESGRP